MGFPPSHDFINRYTYKLNLRHLYSVEKQKRLAVAKTAPVQAESLVSPL
jgi:hypothetical protein